MKFSKLFAWKRKGEKKADKRAIPSNGTVVILSPATDTTGAATVLLNGPSTRKESDAPFVPNRDSGDHRDLAKRQSPLRHMVTADEDSPYYSSSLYSSAYSNSGNVTSIASPAIQQPPPISFQEPLSNIDRPQSDHPTSTASALSGPIPCDQGQQNRRSCRAYTRNEDSHQPTPGRSSTPQRPASWPRARSAAPEMEAMVREAFSRPIIYQDLEDSDDEACNENIAQEYLAELENIEPPWSRANPSLSARSHTTMPPLRSVPKGRAKLVVKRKAGQQAEPHQARTALFFGDDGEEQDGDSLETLIQELKLKAAEAQARVQALADDEGEGEAAPGCQMC